MTELLTIGPVHNITQNTVYALPARQVFVFATDAVEVSNEIGASFTALTGADTVGALTSATWIRCTGAGGTELTLKAS